MYRKVAAGLAVAAWLAGASHAVAQVDSTADSTRVTAKVQSDLDAQASADLFRRPAMSVDHIVAVVGKQAIMQSQLDEQFFQLLGGMPPAAAPKTAADSARIRKQVLSDLVDDELLVQEAARDTSIKVTDKEVFDAVTAAVKNIRDRYTTEIEFTTQLHAAGFSSLDEYRRFLAEQSRRDMQKERLKQLLKDKGKLKPIAPSEQEMKAFFEEQQGQFGSRPATVTFQQVVVAPRPSDAAKSRALALADSILVELRKGADFAVAAKRFSADPGSRERGGDLGWARRGLFVPEFDRVAFSLKIGVISEPGGDAVRVPPHPGDAHAARRDPGAAHPHCGRGDRGRRGQRRGARPAGLHGGARRRIVRLAAARVARRHRGARGVRGAARQAARGVQARHPRRPTARRSSRPLRSSLPGGGRSTPSSWSPSAAPRAR